MIPREGRNGEMANLFLGFSLLLGLGAAVWAVLAAQNLQRTYGTSALSTFLYYQIFVAVFGLYGIAGQGIVKMILVARNSSFQTVETVWHLFAILGAPFLILAWSMFLRLSREISDETPGRGTTRGFLSAAFALYIAYGAILVILSTSKAGDEAWKAFTTSVKGLFAGLDAAVIAASACRVLWRSGSIAEGPKRSAIRAFGWTAAAACLGRLIFFIISGRASEFLSLYILVFFAGNAFPLIVWRAYLIKSVLPPMEAGVRVGDIGEFSAAFNISKREEEVVRQVLEGKTNKEIAASLFITVQTVKDHLYRVFQKADVRSRVQLINLVRTYGAGGRDTPPS
jgi:DNA-binding CsgD family transcriptional regulator